MTISCLNKTREIAHFFRKKGLELTREPGDDTTTVAELAQFTSFELPDPREMNEKCAAIYAIVAAFKFQVSDWNADHRATSYVKFTDGSAIHID